MITEQERQAALDALDILVAHCVLDDNFCNELKEEVRAALSSPAVPVIEGLSEAIVRYDSGDLCNTGGKWNDVAWQAARAYAELQKGA